MNTGPSSESEDSPSPAVHSAHIRRELSDLIEHLEADRDRVPDPHFQGLLSTSAAVLRGVSNAYAEYDEKQSQQRHLSG